MISIFRISCMCLTASVLSGSFMVFVFVNNVAAIECNETTIEERVEKSSIIFVGEIAQARSEILGEYKYYRMPGSQVWMSESAVPKDSITGAELRISRDTVFYAKFIDVKPMKGSIDNLDEIQMGNTHDLMDVALGGIYLIFTSDGNTTSYCEGSKRVENREAKMIEEIDGILAKESKGSVSE